jgi:arylsulfatase
LYHLDEDFSECVDRSQSEAPRLKEMIDLWWAEAERHGVLPLDDRLLGLIFRASMRPGLPTARRRFVYYPPISRIVSDACPPVGRGWSMTLELDHPRAEAEGALAARGSINSGFVLYLKNGRPHFDYNCFHHHTMVAATEQLAVGRRRLEVRVERTDNAGASVSMSVDDVAVGAGRIPNLLRIISSAGMDLGRSISPVNTDYTAPFAYTGRIHSIVFELPAAPQEPEVAAEAEARAKVAMTRQ